MALKYIKILTENPLFRLLWFAHSISLIGDWFTRIALLDFVSTIEESAIYYGLVLVCSFLPPFLLGPVAGVIADRFDRKNILIICDVVRGFLVLFFLFVTPEWSWSIFIIEFIVFSFSAFFQPAKNSLIPVITTKDQLASANALTQISWGVMLALGAFLGGVVVEHLGFKTAIIIDSVTFFGSAFFIVLMKTIKGDIDNDESLKLENRNSWLEFIEGLKLVKQDRFLLVFMMIKPAWAFAGGAVLTLHAKFSNDVFKAGSFGIGLLYMCRGIGVIFGSFLGNQYLDYGKLSVVWAVSFIFIMYGILYGTFSQMTYIYPAAVLLTLATTVSSNLWLFSRVILQKTVPNEYRGRIFAMDDGLTMLFLMTSSLVSGWLLDYFQPQSIALITALIMSLIGIMTLIGILVGFIPKYPKLRS